MTIKELRRLAFPGCNYFSDESLTACAAHYRRHPRSIQRWDANPNPDPLILDALQFRAGFICGLPNYRAEDGTLRTPCGVYGTEELEMLGYTVGLLRDALRELEAQNKTLRQYLPERLLSDFLAGLQDQPTPPALPSLYARITAVATTTTLPREFASTPASNCSESPAPTGTATQNPPA